MSDAISDINKALHQLRVAFARHNIPCPDVLEYSDPGKAYGAIFQLRGALGPTAWVKDLTATAYGEASIAGFTLRFEARKMEQPGCGPYLDD